MSSPPSAERGHASLVLRVAFTALLSPLVLASVHAADDALTPEHVAKLRSVSSAAVSPDGRSIAYRLTVPRTLFEEDDGPAHSELHVVRPDGETRAYVHGDVSVGAIAWTPDGAAISFLAKRGDDEHRSLYVIPIDGGEARRVLAFDTDVESYSWSPDGRRVAFTAKEKEPEKRAKEKEKGFKQEIYEEDHRTTRVWIAVPEAEGEAPRALELPGSPSELHWSPVGSRIAVALAPTPHIDDHYMRRRVHVVDVDSAATVATLETIGKLGSVAWNPEGTHLAVIGAEDIHDPAEGRLLVAEVASGSVTDILPDYPGHVSSLGWKDADSIVFLGDEGVWSTVHEIQRDGSARTTRVAAGQLTARSLSLARDGSALALVADRPTHPSELFVLRSDDAAPRRLTDSNPWLSEVRLATQEVIRFPARDGLEIEAILLRPRDEERGRRYPLIVSVHGGPEAHHRNGWLTWYSGPGQVAAARGFAVLYPNYRGSTGRGVAFSKLGQADYAGKEFDDLIDGIDHLVEAGLVDRDHVGVTGGSYGGYATAWCSTYHSERFAAGVMFVGVSDLVSKAGTTDIPDEMALVHARKRPWEAWDFFRQRSPIYHVEKARTPLLIMHGKDDPRVHPSQSLELYRHLKTLDRVPVRLVWYPGEGHGNRKAAARYDYHLRMLRWFEHYLQGSGGAPPDPELDHGGPEEPEETDDADPDQR